MAVIRIMINKCLYRLFLTQTNHTISQYWSFSVIIHATVEFKVQNSMETTNPKFKHLIILYTIMCLAVYTV